MRNVSLNPDHRIARLRALQQVWEALHNYREDAIPEGIEPRYDEEWNYICESMDVIHKVMGIEQEEV